VRAGLNMIAYSRGFNRWVASTVIPSDPTNPVTGRGKIDFNRAAPMIAAGWGNLISRQPGKHFSVPVELGLAH
jgi:hypothetical protein